MHLDRIYVLQARQRTVAAGAILTTEDVRVVAEAVAETANAESSTSQQRPTMLIKTLSRAQMLRSQGSKRVLFLERSLDV